MTMVHVDVRMRPIRFGFLVAPTDKAALAEVFSINTCLWGGKFNPVIPIFASRPYWWERDGPAIESAEQIVNGFLDYFEPDILVETRPGQAAKLGFAENRVIAIGDLVSSRRRRGDGLDKAGLSISSLYRHLYRREFQFARRQPEKTIRITSATRALACLAACLFGAFPRAGAFHELERAYDEVFTPELLTLGADNAADIISNNWLNPLHITHEDLEIEYGH